MNLESIDAALLWLQNLNWFCRVNGGWTRRPQRVETYNTYVTNKWMSWYIYRKDHNLWRTQLTVPIEADSSIEALTYWLPLVYIIAPHCSLLSTICIYSQPKQVWTNLHSTCSLLPSALEGYSSTNNQTADYQGTVHNQLVGVCPHSRDSGFRVSTHNKWTQSDGRPPTKHHKVISPPVSLQLNQSSHSVCFHSARGN
jgi:hypothetical protein